MLWDLIRDYFVQYVFGGFDSNGTAFNTNVGQLYFNDGGNLEPDANNLNDIMVTFGKGDITEYYLGFADWLSTTATIITISIIIILCGLFIKKMVSTVANLMSR